MKINKIENKKTIALPFTGKPSSLLSSKCFLFIFLFIRKQIILIDDCLGENPNYWMIQKKLFLSSYLIRFFNLLNIYF